MLLLCFSQKFALVFEFKYFSRYYCIPCPSKIVIVVLLVLTVQCSILAASFFFLFSHTRGRGLVLLAQFMFSGFGALSRTIKSLSTAPPIGFPFSHTRPTLSLQSRTCGLPCRF